MHIKKGKGRLVIVLPLLDVVIKIPLIQGINFLIGVWKAFVGKTYTERLLKIDTENVYFRGVLENWREFTFWNHTQNPFLQPTYFSFFGLLNIQKFGKPHDIKDTDLLYQIQYYTKWFCWEHIHSFENPSNYCLDDEGKIRIVDYGNPYAQKVIERFGKECHEGISTTFKDGIDDAHWVELQKIGIEYGKFKQKKTLKS